MNMNSKVLTNASWTRAFKQTKENKMRVSKNETHIHEIYHNKPP